MTLYEIDREIMNCVDAETGAIMDSDKLDAFSMAREKKIENIALYIKNLKAEAAAIKGEVDTLNKRKTSAENKAESLAKYLSRALGGAKFTSAKCDICFRSSEETTITDESKIPPEYFKETVVRKPDKAAIKAAINNGIDIEGAKIVTKLNAQIK